MYSGLLYSFGRNRAFFTILRYAFLQSSLVIENGIIYSGLLSLAILADRIVEAPQKHVKQAESEKIFATRYSTALLARALDGACNDAPQSERDELREYLSSRLGGERIQKAVEAKVRKDVLPKWREARATAAKRQADDTWPTLADGTWFPPADLADDVTARSDYAKSVKEWRSLAALKSLADAPNGRPLMEEADSRADSEVAAAFDIARSAIATQNAIVDGCHAQVLAEAKKRKDSFWTRTPDLKTIVGLLTQATEESWEASRFSTLWPDEAKRPANAAEQHKALFPSVRRKIELLARTILEEIILLQIIQHFSFSKGFLFLQFLHFL